MTGSGTLADPYIIWDVDDLQNMSLDLTAYYELGQDIDASATSGWNAGKGFQQIGTPSYPFTGSLDGKGHVVSSLFMNRDDPYVGLIGYAGAGSIISNIGIIDCDTTGRCNGALIGILYGTLRKAYSTGIVKSIYSGCGGLVGLASGSASVENCYSRCESSGVNYAAGFLGMLRGNASVLNCYSTGEVSWTGTAGGGFIGFNDSTGDVEHCFWDKETSTQTTSFGGTGKTTAEMKTESTFTNAGWDFATIWTICSGVNNDYPCLIGVTPIFTCPRVGCGAGFDTIEELKAHILSEHYISFRAYALSREEL